MTLVFVFAKNTKTVNQPDKNDEDLLRKSSVSNSVYLK